MIVAIGSPVPVAALLDWIRVEKRTKARQGYHDDGNGRLHCLPEKQPDGIRDVTRKQGSGDADNGYNDHKNGETEHCCQGKLPFKTDLNHPEQAYGD